MNRVTSIVQEIKEKSGREFLGLALATEKQLKSLAWYLEHPKVQKKTHIADELIELYENAKANSFLKMESIKRKLDQLDVTLGKEDYTKTTVASSAQKTKAIPRKSRPRIAHYGEAIKELRNKVETLMGSSEGQSLPEAVQQSLIKFLNYLNHPKLESKQELFHDMLAKYGNVEELGFIKMQAFNDMLDMAEIKLGKISEEMKTWKSPEDLQKELEEREVELEGAQKQLEEERQKIQEEWKKLEQEKKSIEEERKKLEEEKKRFRDEKRDFERERANFRLEKTLEEEEKRAEKKINKDTLHPPK